MVQTVVSPMVARGTKGQTLRNTAHITSNHKPHYLLTQEHI